MKTLLLLIVLSCVSPVIQAMDFRAQASQTSEAMSLDNDDTSSIQPASSHAGNDGEQKEAEESLESVIQKFKSAYTTNFVSGLLEAGTISKEMAQKMGAKGATVVLEQLRSTHRLMEHTMSDRAPSFKNFLRTVISKMPTPNPDLSLNKTNDWDKQYAQNDVEAIVTINQGENYLNKIQYIYYKCCQDVYKKPISEYLTEKLPILERLLKSGINPNFNRFDQNHNNILQIILSHDLFIHSTEIINRNIHRPLLSLIDLLMYCGLILTEPNADGKNTLDIMMEAQKAIESQGELQDLSDNTNEEKRKFIKFIFNSFKQVMIKGLNTKNAQRQQFLNVITSNCLLASTMAGLVCDYLSFFDREPEINLLYRDYSDPKLLQFVP